MFRKIKHKLLTNGRIKNYLKYALGEVLLIVIGILIAVSINNWNRNRAETEIKKGIFHILLNDIQIDLKEVKQILDYYEDKRSTFEKVIADTLSQKEILECNHCRYLITGRRLLTINTRGFQQLNRSINTGEFKSDSLTFDVVNFYTTLDDEVEKLNSLINEDIIENLKHWRDTYPWYASSSIGELKEEAYVRYFANDPEYKNRVAFHYMLIYENYVPVLKTFQAKSEMIVKDVKARMDEK
ncbi:hypothetical protein FHS59_000084 [Algoriphagus iocasae]|uniref:Uncharacterized protein n=1 Tax=Algoriphagus iocasae TaxID=1836499 RepID=A0A841MGK6_9BACT|nr:DUF6090 family protein [Algoriphagus iocasae]MBB6324469.1 hypothetical protein [Algoriphagus iocasae]